VNDVDASDLIRGLRQLEAKVERRIGVKANRAGAQRLQQHLKRALPVDPAPGVHLRDSLKIKKVRGAQIAHDVGVTGGARHYAHILEFGSRYVAPGGHWRRTIDSQAQDVFARIKEVIARELAKQ